MYSKDLILICLIPRTHFPTSSLLIPKKIKKGNVYQVCITVFYILRKAQISQRPENSCFPLNKVAQEAGN